MKTEKNQFEIAQNVSFLIFNFSIFHPFLVLSGNTVWPKAYIFQETPDVVKWDFFCDF